MSLLMDALKKAELAKRQGQVEGASELPATEAKGGGLTLELIPEEAPAQPKEAPPTPEAKPADGRFPSLPSHLEELDARFLAEAAQAASARLKSTAPPPVIVRETPPVQANVPPAAASAGPVAAPRTHPGPSEQGTPHPQEQAAAQNVFAAKQADKPTTRKGFAIAIGVMTVLSVCGVGGYFWWQLQPKSTLLASRPPPVPSAQPTPVAAAPVPAPAPQASTATNPAASAKPSAAGDGDKAQPAAAAEKNPDAKPSRATTPRATPAIEAEEAPVRITKAPLKVNPSLMRGFDAFNRGDLAAAQVEYERAQKSDPRNTDVLHGLAAIALRQGRSEQAEWLYQQITEADPQDKVATSALINMRGQIDPNAAESRLKSMAAEQPGLAAPHFALGNLYARHGRWSEAQQAYFRAYSAEPDNPDILYNLAISLEHLRQNKLATQYYSQALAAAKTRPAGFDKATAAARLSTLQP